MASRCHRHRNNILPLLVVVTVVLLACVKPSLSFTILPAPVSLSANYASTSTSRTSRKAGDGGDDTGTPARQSLPEHLSLSDIPGKGTGVITNVLIPMGTVVGDYVGEVLTAEEKDRRYLKSQAHLRLPADDEWRESRLARGQTVTGTYLYGVTVPNGPPIYIDAEDEYESLWTRFLNHAPPPFAANVNPKSIHESWNGKPRVWFVSMRDIDIGEEVCFDYGDDYWLPEDNVV